MDHSEDSDNGMMSHYNCEAFLTVVATEIENLRQEAQALKQIRASMGSNQFPRKVFQKVFQEDVERLRSMEEMWKSRRPPEMLDYEKLREQSASMDPSVASQDQRKWTVEENVAVFVDRSVS